MVRAYGTCIAIEGAGVLLRGPPGSGKSDLALRLIDQGALLVADDQTELRLDDDVIVASAPATILGRIEVRGVGILSCPSVARAPLRLIVDLVPPVAVERLPAAETERCLGLALPLLRLSPFESSAPVKLRWALRACIAAGVAPSERIA